MIQSRFLPLLFLPGAIMTGAGALHADVIHPEKSSWVILKQPGRYIGWPTVAKTAEGELIVVFSGDREAHVCPFGKTQMIRSRDGGKTWSKVQTINNTPLDDRDAGVIQTTSGALLVSWFTSVAFETPSYTKRMNKARLERWKPHVSKITDADRKRWLGYWTRRSPDGGETWEDPVKSHVTGPHGMIQLADGRCLYLGMRTVDGKRRVSTSESTDDGKSWHVISTVPLPDMKGRWLCEPHVAEASPGRLVGMMRIERVKHEDHVLWQTESDDGGRTWSQARPTKIWGYPPHLIRLRDGRVLVTYGYRRKPYGQRACLSRDGGRTWDLDRIIAIRDDAPSGDLGYPASVELSDGWIFTVYYQIDKPGEKTCLMATKWKLPE